MKIIPHPFLLQKKERELIDKECSLNLREYHVDISLALIEARDKEVKNKIRKIKLISISCFISGFIASTIFFQYLV